MNNFFMKAISNPILLDIQAGLTAAKDEVINNIKPIINNIAIPMAATVLLVIFFFFLVMAWKRHKNGEGYGAHLATMAIILVVLVLVVSATKWLWAML